MVPAHFGCHRETFQHISNVITGTHFLLKRGTDEDIDHFARMQHDKSDYWGSAIAELVGLQRTPEQDRAKRLRLTKHLLSSLSGIGTHAVPAIVKGLDTSLQHDPGILFHTANLYANRGNKKKGMEIFEHAKERYEKSNRKKREEELYNLANRRLQFQPSITNAKEAQIISESNAYTRSTSLVLTSSLLFNIAPSVSDASLEELTDAPTQQPWLYYAESLFIQARRELANQRQSNPEVTSSVDGKLMKAQCILCMMGHRCVPHPSLPFLGHKNRSTIMPSEVLVSLARPKRLSPRKCSEIPEQCIQGSDLFSRIMRTLGTLIDPIDY